MVHQDGIEWDVHDGVGRIVLNRPCLLYTSRCV